MEHSLKGKRVAVLATNGVEHSELTEPKRALEQAGATVDVVSLEPGQITSWTHKNWGDAITVDKVVDQVKADQYDALLLPGGVINPDQLRMHRGAVAFARSFFDQGKPIAAICHGPWTLVEAGVVKGLKITSWPSLRTDLVNAGASWVDEEVVNDRGVVSSRKPADIPAFNRKMIEEFAEGQSAAHRSRAA